MEIVKLRMDDLALMPPEIVPINYTERDVETIERMLAEHGQPVPVLVQADSNRVFWQGDIWIAAKRLQLGEINAICLDVDDRKAARMAIQLRRAGEHQAWHQKELAEALATFEDFENLGFTEKEFESLLAEVAPPKTRNTIEDMGTKPDAQLEYLRGVWKTEEGQLWEIPSQSVEGKCHRLLIASSADAANVKRLMDGQRADLFATDPPYAINYTGDERPGKSSGKDWSAVYKEVELTEDDSIALYRGFMKAAIDEAITEHAAWYCWHASKRQAWLEALWAEFGVMLHQQIIWLKTRPVLTHSTYLWKHEPCLHGWIKGNKPVIAQGMMGRHSSVWEAENPHGSEDNLHPTSKPTLLFEIPMLTHTEPRAICYEPFSGSGSQLVAGEKLGRLVYGLEISPYFVAGMLQRISEMGCKPRLVEV